MQWPRAIFPVQNRQNSQYCIYRLMTKNINYNAKYVLTFCTGKISLGHCIDLARSVYTYTSGNISRYRTSKQLVLIRCDLMVKPKRTLWWQNECLWFAQEVQYYLQHTRINKKLPAVIHNVHQLGQYFIGIIVCRLSFSDNHQCLAIHYDDSLFKTIVVIGRLKRKRHEAKQNMLDIQKQLPLKTSGNVIY